MEFFTRSKDKSRPSSSATPHVISQTGRNYSALSENDTSLKFWIPEPLEKKIDELCSFFDTSASDFIRQVLFIHLYGRYDLVGLIERQDNRFDLTPRQQFKFSLRMQCEDSPSSTPSPPKNIADIKVWLPAGMKTDLQELANRRSMKLSRYIRLVLISHWTLLVECQDIDNDFKCHDIANTQLIYRSL